MSTGFLVADFFTGVRQTVLAPNEMLIELVVPPPGAHSGGQYLRHTPRRELDIAVVGVASQLTMADGRCTKVRIALASVAPTPVRAIAAESMSFPRNATNSAKMPMPSTKKAMNIVFSRPM